MNVSGIYRMDVVAHPSAICANDRPISQKINARVKATKGSEWAIGALSHLGTGRGSRNSRRTRLCDKRIGGASRSRPMLPADDLSMGQGTVPSPVKFVHAGQRREEHT
jgi:hypothetical protein